MQSLVKQIEADSLFAMGINGPNSNSNSKKCQTFVKGQYFRIDVLIQEGNKKRIQSYTGQLVSQHRAGLNSTITVRKLSKGIGVERIFPIYSPDIDTIEQVDIKKKGKRKKGRKFK